ncbi:MAG: AGE family epimerase/isomerase [Pirellulales bacterium]|nr:AGE family epimerase/isomerase [Pirellulales bacterium]
MVFAAGVVVITLGTGVRLVRAESPDYLRIACDYADAMIAQGRDTYGSEHSPLFAEALDRSTMRMLEGDALKKVEAIPREPWGVRPHDRMISGGNPQHCENLYQVLYALAELTGKSRYAEEADRSLEFFFKHCQSPATGLFWWGEHAGWDFHGEKPIDKPAGKTHEFYRPWVLWQQSWRLAPEACRRFALGLWEHQIGNHETGDFSRHAAIDAHAPGADAPYARHGGFYIETWAAAYEKTGEEVFLHAIESVLDGLERARLREGGYLIGGSKRNGGRRDHDLSLAVSLGNAAATVPAALAAKLRGVATTNDEIFAKSFAGAGGAGLWSNAYGGSPLAGVADVWMLRYRQVGSDVYRRAVVDAADRYRTSKINLGEPLWPGTVGSAVLLMLNAHELTGEKKYLDAADRFAQEGVRLFLADGRPLPKASHMHDHYEAVTNGDTLMLAFLRLWQVRNRPEAKLEWIGCDR